MGAGGTWNGHLRSLRCHSCPTALPFLVKVFLGPCDQNKQYHTPLPTKICYLSDRSFLGDYPFKLSQVVLSPDSFKDDIEFCFLLIIALSAGYIWPGKWSQCVKSLTFTHTQNLLFAQLILQKYSKSTICPINLTEILKIYFLPN